MEFTSRQLPAFHLVAQHRSFARAAEALFHKGPDPSCFLADEVVITILSPMFLRRADPRRRQDPEA
jgi:hypothetical protein